MKIKSIMIFLFISLSTGQLLADCQNLSYQNQNLMIARYFGFEFAGAGGLAAALIAPDYVGAVSATGSTIQAYQRFVLEKRIKQMHLLLYEIQIQTGPHLAKFMYDVDPTASKEQIIRAFNKANGEQYICLPNNYNPIGVILTSFHYDNLVEATKENL